MLIPPCMSTCLSPPHIPTSHIQPSSYKASETVLPDDLELRLTTASLAFHNLPVLMLGVIFTDPLFLECTHSKLLRASLAEARSNSGMISCLCGQEM